MSFGSRLVTGRSRIDFLRVWKRSLAVSAVLVLLSIGALVTKGLNYGIDFEGGIVWEVSVTGVSIDDARAALEPSGLGEIKIQTVGDDVLRIQAGSDAQEKETEVADELAALAGVERQDVSISTVGPSWGDEITRSAIRALAFFFVAILLYLSVRLEWRMAVGALVAVLHDIIISAGIYALFGFEVTPATVISFLTILGYSIYDTIVVFDKVKENEARPSVGGKLSYPELMNLSMNQVLLRSLNTTVSSLIPVISILVIGSFVLGVTTLRDFSLALAIGLTAGAYSSIFVAAPVVAWLKERDPKRRSRSGQASGASRTRASNPRPSGGKRAAEADAARTVVLPGLDISKSDTEPDEKPKPSPAPPGAAPRPRKKKRR
jgi:preprotein translocase subunit SecF